MEMDGGSAAAMEIEVPHVPSLQLAVNPSLPASLQRWRGSRRGAQRAEIIAQLYCGSWMYSYACTPVLSWFGGWFMTNITSHWQKKNPGKSRLKLRIVQEFLASWMLRLRNKDHLVPFMAALSLYCYIHHVPSDVWEVLTFLRIIYAKNWTKKFCLDMTRKLPAPSYAVSTALYLEAADNNFILVRVGLQRVGATHKNVDQIQRIQFSPYAPSFDSVAATLTCIWQCPESWRDLQQRLQPSAVGLGPTLLKEWTHRVTSGELQTITQRPATPIGMKTHMCILRPELASASKAEHVDRYMHKVIKRARGKTAIGICGDQAFEKVVWGRVLMRSRQFKKIFTIADWFHITCWILAAVWEQQPLHFLYFVDLLKLRNRGKQVMFSAKLTEVEKYTHYEGMMLSYILGVHSFLMDVTEDKRVLFDERLWLQSYGHNQPLRDLYKSFIFALHWFELKRSVNEFRFDKLERLMPTLYHIACSTRHTNVADQLLRIEWQRQAMVPTLWQARMQHSICALTNKACIGVGTTFPVERLNLYVKQGCVGVTDVNAISDYCETLNATMPVEEHLHTWFGGKSHDKSAWVGNIHSNATAIRNHLVEELGSTHARLTLPRIDHCFGYSRHEQNGGDKFDMYLGGLATDEETTENIRNTIREYTVVFNK